MVKNNNNNVRKLVMVQRTIAGEIYWVENSTSNENNTKHSSKSIKLENNINSVQPPSKNENK